MGNQINDCITDALSGSGYTGALNDQMVAWLQAGGATSGSISDAWAEFLIAEGMTPAATNDMLFEWLSGKGHTGSLSDMALQYWCGDDAGGPAAIARLPYASSDGAVNYADFVDQRSVDMLLLDAYGAYVTVPAGDLVYPGARYVSNILQKSEGFEAADIATASTSPVYYQNGAVWTVDSIDLGVLHVDINTAASNSQGLITCAVVSTGEHNQKEYKASIYMKAGTPADVGKRVKAQPSMDSGYLGGPGLDVYLTADWARYDLGTIAGTTATASTRLGIGILSRTVGDFGAENVDFKKPMIEEVTNRSGTVVPSEYVSAANGTAIYLTENGNTVDGDGIVTDVVGADISPYPELTHYPAGTNEADYTEDGTLWPRTGAVVSPTDAEQRIAGRKAFSLAGITVNWHRWKVSGNNAQTGPAVFSFLCAAGTTTSLKLAVKNNDSGIAGNSIFTIGDTTVAESVKVGVGTTTFLSHSTVAGGHRYAFLFTPETDGDTFSYEVGMDTTDPTDSILLAAPSVCFGTLDQPIIPTVSETAVTRPTTDFYIPNWTKFNHDAGSLECTVRFNHTAVVYTTAARGIIGLRTASASPNPLCLSLNEAGKCTISDGTKYISEVVPFTPGDTVAFKCRWDANAANATTAMQIGSSLNGATMSYSAGTYDGFFNTTDVLKLFYDMDEVCSMTSMTVYDGDKWGEQ